MASIKTVSVVGVQDASARMDVTAGRHRIVIDQPPSGGGQDEGPSPLEFFQAALAGCIGAIARLAARQQRIPFRGIEVRVEGRIDADGLLGRPGAARVGFESFDLTVKLDADLTPEQKRAFVDEVERRCPVSENIENPTPIRVICDAD